MGDVPK